MSKARPLEGEPQCLGDEDEAARAEGGPDPDRIWIVDPRCGDHGKGRGLVLCVEDAPSGDEDAASDGTEPIQIESGKGFDR